MTERSEEVLERLLRLPWTIEREVTPEGDVLLRVKEVPSAVGTGDTDEEREADLWEALAESLRAYLHFGDPVPVPADAPSQWPHGSLESPPRPVIIFVDPLNASTAAALIAGS